MCREKVVFMVAGTLVLTGLALGYFVAHAWFLLSAFVGANMLQASITGFCPLAKILRASGVQACVKGSPTS